MKLYSQTIHFVVVSSVFAAATRAEVAAPAALLRRLDATAGAAGAAAEKLEAALRRLTGRTRGAERRKSTTLLLHYRSERRADGAVIFAAEGGPARLELLEAVEVLDDGGEGRRGDDGGGGTTEGVRLLHKLRRRGALRPQGARSIDTSSRSGRTRGRRSRTTTFARTACNPTASGCRARTADGRAAALLAQLAADSAFLREVGVMDAATARRLPGRPRRRRRRLARLRRRRGRRRRGRARDARRRDRCSAAVDVGQGGGALREGDLPVQRPLADLGGAARPLPGALHGVHVRDLWHPAAARGGRRLGGRRAAAPRRAPFRQPEALV